MKVLLVDDENLALVKMKKILSDIGDVTGIFAYNKPEEALSNAKKDNADIAFIDIDMPGINGLDLAERLAEELPDLCIVFVTAYDKFALRAFQVHAMGYLLKPVQADDVEKELELFQKRNCKYKEKNKETSLKNTYLHICSFGDFSCRVNEKYDLPVNFRTEKAMELLAFLLCQSGKAVLKDIICDNLWPDMDMERATKNFYTTCYYLRKVFNDAGYQNVIVRRSNSYMLNMEVFLTDFSIMDKAIEGLNNKLCSLDDLEAAVNVYNGSFLSNKDYSWSVSKASYYERCFEKLSLFLAGKYIQDSKYDKAEYVLNKLMKTLPFCEKSCEMLVGLYLKMGDKPSAAKTLKNFTDNYIREMGEAPDIRQGTVLCPTGAGETQNRQFV